MTEHNLKELKRQLDDAKSKLKQAQARAEQALSMYNEARIAKADKEFAKRGIHKGAKVKLRNGKIGIYLGHEVAYSFPGPSPVYARTKKDGTAHKSARFYTRDEIPELAE